MPFPSADPRVDRLLREILASRVYDVARETPLDPATRLSARVGAQVLLKREDLQPVFSFKLRGAYNKIAHLAPARRAGGVICASAGNHGQGVAYAAPSAVWSSCTRSTTRWWWRGRGRSPTSCAGSVMVG